MLPEGWRDLLLDAIAKRNSGHTPNKEKPSYWNGGIKWVSLADSWRLDKGLISETDKEISEDGLRNSSAVLLPEGTVVLSRDAGVGKSAVISMPMAVSQHFIAWDCRYSADLHNWFLYHWLQSKKPEFDRVSNGSTIKTIGLPYFKRLRLLAPPISEQRKIALLLNMWDKAVALAEQLLANSQKQKQALIGRLLRRQKQKKSAAKWSFFDLDALFERVVRKNAEGNDNVLTISGEHGLISQREYFNKSVASENLSGYTLIRKGEFAYNKSYSNGYPMGAIKPLQRYEAGVVSSLYICFRIRDDVEADLDFFRHYFEAGLLNEALMGVAQEGARNHGLLNVGVGDFFKLRLEIPTIKEQRRIAAILNAADAEIDVIAKQLAALRNEKQALMQQLLTGKRRVKLPAAAKPLPAKPTSAKPKPTKPKPVKDRRR